MSMGDKSEEEPSEPTLWEDIYLEDDGEEYFEAEDSSKDKKRDLGLSGPWDTPKQYIPCTGFSKYHPALKNLIPVRRKKKGNNVLGLDEANLWDYLSIKWLTKYFDLAYNKGILKVEDIPSPSPFDTCEYNVQRLETIWNEEVTRKGTPSASLGYATWRFLKTRIIVSSILLTIHVVLNFLAIAFFMRYLLEFIENENSSFWDGLLWTFLLAFTELIRVTIYSLVWVMNYRTSMRLRSAYLAMLYRKILRVYCLENKTVGEMVNMFANDGQRVFDLMLFAPMIFAGPVSLLLGAGFVLWSLGPWPLFGLSVMFLFYPIQYGLSRISAFFKSRSLKLTDLRVSTLTNMLSNMRFVKVYAWTDIFKDQIDDIRKRETSLVEKIAYFDSLSSSISTTVPVLSAILTFIIHILLVGNLSASQAFPIISMLTTQMRTSLAYFQFGLSNIVDHNIICKRFKSVLLLNESSTYLSRPLDKSQALCIANGFFACYLNNQASTLKKDKKFKNGVSKKDVEDAEPENKASLIQQLISPRYQVILFDINFYAPKGSLIGICGPVGSGKTSLLSGILGQLRMTEGKLCREGSCAYASQQAWLMNATLKENILFGEKFNAKRYFAVLQCCALNKDIDLLPGADETEIGEKGINLSGGQKQRVALARAIYSNRDIYLLDDPLSAVDPQIAVQIFEKGILSALAKKTVIFVSHKIEFLSRCDEIVFMKEGRILDRGNHNDLMSKSTDYKTLVETYANEEELKVATLKKTRAEKAKKRTIRGEKKDGKLIKTEKMEQGSIQCSTFIMYVRAAGGVFVSFMVIVAVGFSVGSSAFSSWWLAQWIKAGSGADTIHNITKREAPGDLEEFTTESVTTEETTELTTTTDFTTETFIMENITSPIFYEGNLTDNPDFSYYQLVYCLCIAVIFLASILRGIFIAKACIYASKNIHNLLLDKVLKAKMVFFETIPIGRYQNLFSKDIDEIETRLLSSLESLLQSIWQIGFALLFICMALPAFVAPLIVIGVVFFYVNRIFRNGLRELKRLDNVTRSPIFSNITCTITGLDTIHAFAKEKAFLQKFITSFDVNATCMFMTNVANRWLALRIDLIAVFSIFITSLFIVVFRFGISPAMAGLAIAYASTLSGLFQFTVRMMTTTELKFLSVERIDTCIKSLEQEGGHGPKGIPPITWPDNGAISFRNVKLRYRAGLPFALNDISFYIQPKEKIGIVGRTGAGKTSLISALFRLVEVCEGSITIDNLDISTLDLNSLRKQLSLIPQDPVLFAGTVRSNLDPTKTHNDKAIWDALKKVGLKDRIGVCDGKLDAKVNFGGDNFSTGEIQQLCLARALLKKAKVMVFDEATSSLDLDTESVVHRTIFQELKDCTVLIIAHRLETVKNCSRILVIDDGKLVEFDEPQVLLQNQNSYFYKMNAPSRLHQK